MIIIINLLQTKKKKKKNINTFMVSINGMFDNGDLELFLFSQPNDEVPLSFDPSDSVIKLTTHLFK